MIYFNGSVITSYSIHYTKLYEVYTAAIQNKAKELKVKGKFGVDHFDYALIEKLMATDSVAEAKVEMPQPDAYQSYNFV